MFNTREPIVLERDTDAVLIPAGTPVRIPGGTEVTVTQALGGTFTVFVNGNLARIDAKDADALGMEVEQQEQAQKTADGPVDEEQVWAQLKTVYDPEIPVDIVELGLIYEMKVTPTDAGGNRVDVTMTLTAPGCGMGEYIKADVEQKVASVKNVTDTNVELTFDPPWDRTRMSDAAKLALGMY
jgi:probable FeS assembly SUF system protein SufT